MRTISAKQWEVLRARSVIVDQCGDVRSVRVDGRLLRKQVVGNLFRRYPDVVGSSQVALVDGTILLAPVRKLDEPILLWYVWY